MTFLDGTTLGGRVPIKDRRYKGTGIPIKTTTFTPEELLRIQRIKQLQSQQLSASQTDQDLEKLLGNLSNIIKI